MAAPNSNSTSYIVLALKKASNILLVTCYLKESLILLTYAIDFRRGAQSAQCQGLLSWYLSSLVCPRRPSTKHGLHLIAQEYGERNPRSSLALTG